jgi:hypothetical protein
VDGRRREGEGRRRCTISGTINYSIRLIILSRIQAERFKEAGDNSRTATRKRFCPGNFKLVGI